METVEVTLREVATEHEIMKLGFEVQAYADFFMALNQPLMLKEYVCHDKVNREFWRLAK